MSLDRHPASHSVPIVAIAIVAAIFLWAAIYNGGPFYMEADSNGILKAGFKSIGAAFFRPPFYGMFVAASSLHLSLWLTIAIQSVLLAISLFGVVRILRPETAPWTFVAVCLFTAISTTASYYVGYVKSDIFGAIVILSIFGLLFENDRRWLFYWYPIFCFGALFHLLNLIFAIVFCGLLALWRLFKRRNLHGRIWFVLATSGVLFLIPMATNFVVHGQFITARGSPVNVSGRLFAAGLLQRHLDKTCDESPNILCPFADRMKTMNRDQFLWTDPVTGKFLRQNHMSLGSINNETIAAYPIDFLKFVIQGVTDQLTMRSDHHLQKKKYIPEVLGDFFPRMVESAVSSKQYTGKGVWLHEMLTIMGTFCLVVSVMFIGWALLPIRRQLNGDRRLHYLVFFSVLLTCYVTGMIVGGGLVDPQARWQVRFDWIFTFLAILLGVEIFAKRAKKRALPFGKHS